MRTVAIVLAVGLFGAWVAATCAIAIEEMRSATQEE